ncbi:unnamed protein product [Effrenium voratum]|nr:unnamed protein product [Effrenium voratum]
MAPQNLRESSEVEDTASDPSTEFSEASDVECSDSQSDDEPPAFYNEDDTVLIFDWDDTMLPSSWLSEQKLSLDAQSKATPEQEAQLETLAEHAAETLTLAKRFGKVVLVTNAERGWIELSCQKFMPSLYVHLQDRGRVAGRKTLLRSLDL